MEAGIGWKPRKEKEMVHVFSTSMRILHWRSFVNETFVGFSIPAADEFADISGYKASGLPWAVNVEAA